MIKRFFIATLAICGGIAIADACTSLIAGSGATTDGSVMITYAADSHNLYGELYNQPAADYPKGAMRKVVEWDTGKYLGEIPEVPLHLFHRMSSPFTANVKTFSKTPSLCIRCIQILAKTLNTSNT